MKQLNVSNLRTYKTGEALECMNSVSEAYINTSGLPEKLVRRSEEFQTAVNALDKAFNESKAEDNTVKLYDLDKDRLANVQSLNLFARSMKKRSNPETVKMGEMLARVLEHNCSGIHDESYAQKTALINALLKDINESPELTDCIQKLDLAGEIVELTNNNRDFTKLFSSSAVDSKDPPLTLEKRELARQAFVTLVKETEAFAITSDEPAVFEGLLKDTNKLLRKFERPVLLRKSMREKGKGEADDSLSDAQEDTLQTNEDVS